MEFPEFCSLPEPTPPLMQFWWMWCSYEKNDFACWHNESSCTKSIWGKAGAMLLNFAKDSIYSDLLHCLQHFLKTATWVSDVLAVGDSQSNTIFTRKTLFFVVASSELRNCSFCRFILSHNLIKSSCSMSFENKWESLLHILTLHNLSMQSQRFVKHCTKRHKTPPIYL